MNTQEAIEILEQHNLWRRGLPPYEDGGEGLPYTPYEIGEALTHAIERMKRGVPEGWKLVPIDPIAPQIMAGIHCLEKNDDLPNIGYGPKAVRIYKNMIEAYRE